jgi:DNA-binding transcriptional regulator YiaG
MKITLSNGNEISIDTYLAKKLDLMCEKVTKHHFDNLMIIDGDEGFGKSNLASAVCGYVSLKTGRPLTNANVFFLIDDLINFAVKTKKQIIWWDEGALGGLSSEGYTQIQIKLLKLLYIARKKQHFYVFLIPKFYKLKEAIIDRAIALLHVYSRDGVTRGRFAYFKTASMDKLFEYWYKKKEKNYHQFYNSCGSFSKCLPKVINARKYERQKDLAILSIGNTKLDLKDEALNKIKQENIKLKKQITLITNMSKAKKAKHFGISRRTLGRWEKRGMSDGQGQVGTTI